MMGCDVLSVRGGLFALWGKPTIADVDRVFAELDIAFGLAGGPVVYVTRAPVDAPPPDAETTAYLNGRMGAIVRRCSSYHVILEGSGFVGALKRGVLHGMFRVVQRRNTFFVHATAPEVLRKVPKTERPVASALLHRALQAGLLDAPPPHSLIPPHRRAA
jgi:hypothetical protein